MNPSLILPLQWLAKYGQLTSMNMDDLVFDETNIQLVEAQFEKCSHQNGICYWLDTDIMRFLGYSDMLTFKQVIIRAMNTCTSLGEDPADDFIQFRHTDAFGVEGRYKLTRFACFLIAQNANASNIKVKLVQYVLARMADMMNRCDVDRLEARTELTRGEKEMSSVAKSHGIGTGRYDYANFKDAGYRGMYNMSLRQLERHKGFVKKSGSVLYDRMNPTELAANLFRVTQTTEHIKKNEIRGQRQLEDAARRVGKRVRETMETPPENIPLEPTEIKEVKKIGKGAKKKLKSLDEPKSRPSDES